MMLHDDAPALDTDRPAAAKGALAAYAYQQIRERLIFSAYKGGERLVLRPLAASLELSPTPVREALLRLVSEQALELDDRNTACVPALSREVFQEVHPLRADLEERLTRNVAGQIIPEQIAVLEGCHQSFIEGYLAGDPHQSAVGNAAFHSAIAGFSSMSITAGIMQRLWARIGPFYAGTNGLPPASPVEANHPHMLLLEAFRQHDAEAAVAAIRQDFEQARSWLEPLLPA
ncbi:GntR family transcriptional regulator [Acetobacter persici]|uniref:GntR family transcriptional regulator n=1 Tax=Acetobacter persici TaxID=1076596 RepID=UPI001BA5B168|nr:GntR family transcriptional regulator [Acetobacter persici]MBS1014786.1 GntR family transcriptional regulator [Acetobacter persici]